MNLSRALPPPVDDRLLAGPYTNPVAVAELVRTSYALRHMLACTVGEETVTAILSGDSEPAPDGVDARQLAWNLWWFELADFADLFTAWWRCGPDYLRGWHFPTVLTGYARGGPSKEALDAAGIGAATTDAANRRALDLRRETGVGATLEGIGMFAADDAGPDFDLASPASLCALFDSLATADALKAERAAATVRGSIGNVRAVSPGHALLLASARIPAACPNGPGDYGRGAADAADAAARYLRGPAIDANASASPGHALLRAAAALEDAAR